jgi:hypothetical protein
VTSAEIYVGENTNNGLFSKKKKGVNAAVAIYYLRFIGGV